MSEIRLGRSSIGAHWACDGCHAPGDPLGPSVSQLVLVMCLPRLASMRGLLQVQTEQWLQKGRVGFLVLIRIPGEGVQTEETLLLCPESLPFLQAGSWPLLPCLPQMDVRCSPQIILQTERPVHSRLPRMPKSGILGGLVGRKPAPQSGGHHPPSTC